MMFCIGVIVGVILTFAYIALSGKKNKVSDIPDIKPRGSFDRGPSKR